jgi:Domain of unknown function (DUF4385)
VGLSPGPRAAEDHCFDALDPPEPLRYALRQLHAFPPPGPSLYPRVMSYPYSGVDLRKHPEAYRIGRVEPGLYHAEPYKNEPLPLWSSKTREAARKPPRR